MAFPDCKLIFMGLLALLFAAPLRAQTPARPPSNAELLEKIQALQQQLDELKQQLGQVQAAAATAQTTADAASATATAVAETPPAPQLAATGGGGGLRLIDISLDVLTAAGFSSESDSGLQTLQGGGHDPRKRGFTLQNVELSLSGAIDPYFKGESHLIFFVDPANGESTFELEEAFLTTTKLPHGLQVKAGQFFTEFGRLNPTHPHAWRWQDQPLINTRLFGPDGMRGTGVRLSWLSPLPWYSEFYAGAQNANGETMASFLSGEGFFAERAIGGRPFTPRGVRGVKDLLYLARWDNGWDFNERASAKIGVSGVFGPNATGSRGRTRIYGTDLLLKWRPDLSRAWRSLTWETEIMKREYHADAVIDPVDPADPADDVLLAPAARLQDWGGFTQIYWGLSPRWAIGLRYDYVSGSGDNLDAAFAPASRNSDPFRATRTRISPILSWRPSEFSRLRLQYNRDRSDVLTHGVANSLWFGLEFLYGAHPAHKY